MQTAMQAYAPTRRSLRAPPYGLEVRGRPRRNVWVFAGRDAWKQAQIRGPGERLVLPEGEDARTFSWPVAGAELTVRAPGCSLAQVETLAQALIEHGAVLVVVLPDAEEDGRAWRVIRPGGTWRASRG